MKKIKKILDNFTEKDYIENKINLHIHTNLSDGKAFCDEILKSAKQKEYKLIAITDHNTAMAHEQIQDPILLTGVEFDCWFGYVYIHLLAYGIDINHPDIKPFYAKNKSDCCNMLPRLFAKRNVKDLIKAIHNAGGIAVLAHPACYWAFSLNILIKDLIKIGLDGIEVYYPYPRLRSVIKFHSSKKIQKIAEKYPQLIKTGGTDFHGAIF